MFSRHLETENSESSDGSQGDGHGHSARSVVYLPPIKSPLVMSH